VEHLRAWQKSFTDHLFADADGDLSGRFVAAGGVSAFARVP